MKRPKKDATQTQDGARENEGPPAPTPGDEELPLAKELVFPNPVSLGTLVELDGKQRSREIDGNDMARRETAAAKNGGT